MIVNWQAIAAMLISIGGLTAHPELLGFLPEWLSLTLTIAGIVGQALTQQVARIPATRMED
jgi:hypothetical protein